MKFFYALHGEAFKKFNAFMSVIAEVKDPFKRLIKMGERYMEFTFQFPKYYDIMFIMQAPMDCDKKLRRMERRRSRSLSVGKFGERMSTTWSF